MTGHPYDTVYPDYVRVPASLSAYPPTTRSRRSNASFAGSRPRVRGDGRRDTARVTLASTGSRPIDERLLAYFERSDLFGPASVVERADEGRQLVVDVPVERKHFFFGTDANGRDLLTRTLIAGRVSLAIGLLATFVAILIGVLYGASRAISADGSTS